MRIDRLEIQNFRCFEQASLTFERMTVIVAPNGRGKSAILDAIKVVLWPFVAGFDLGSTTNDATGIQIDDVRRERVRAHEMDWRIPSAIRADGHIEAAQLLQEGALPALSSFQIGPGLEAPWAEIRLRNSVRKNTKTRSGKVNGALRLEDCANALDLRIFSVGLGKPDNLPVLAYYGTTRAWNQKRSPNAIAQVNGELLSRSFAYRNCLDPASSYSHFVQWFTRAFQAMRDAQIRNLEKQRPADAELPDEITAPIHAVRNSIDRILTPHTGWRRLSFSSEYQELVLDHDEQGELKVSQLSDGIRNMLAMVGDIAYRCYKLNAHHGAEAPLQTHGIVMIDEVDMHLHPEWQQTVLPDLQDAFPHIQFIVTTHSPQVLSSVDAKCIRRLETVTDQLTGRQLTIVNTVEQQTLGVASSDVLATVMEIDPVPDVEPVRKLSRYHALIQQGLHETPEGLELRGALNSHFGIQHPLILDCDRAIRVQAFKQKLPSQGSVGA